MLIFSLHTLFLILSLGLTYLWTRNPSLSPFNLQATGLLILFYFVTKFVTGKPAESAGKAKGGQHDPQPIILSLLMIALFGVDLSNNFDSLALINLIALFLTTPIAMIFGKKYLQTLEDLGKIKQLNKIISEEETDTLLWLTTRARPTLIRLLDTTSLIISSNLLPGRLQDRLKQLHQDLISLHQSAQTLENDIQDLSP